jgi:hypothetical protein
MDYFSAIAAALPPRPSASTFGTGNAGKVLEFPAGNTNRDIADRFLSAIFRPAEPAHFLLRNVKRKITTFVKILRLNRMPL